MCVHMYIKILAATKEMQQVKQEVEVETRLTDMLTQKLKLSFTSQTLLAILKEKFYNQVIFAIVK